MVYQSLDFQQLLFFLRQDLVSDGVFIRRQQLSRELLLINCPHLHHFFSLEMLGPLSLHVIELLPELHGIISLDELLIDFFDAAA